MVSWNTAPLLERSLEALPAALGELDAEVVLVDCASTDGSVAVARRHANVTVLALTTNIGFSAGMSRALAGGDAEHLVALNPNTLAPPGSIEALVSVLRDDPSIGLVSPRLVGPGGEVQTTALPFPSFRVAASFAFAPRALLRGRRARHLLLPTAGPPEEARDVDWTLGAVHAIRRAALAGEAPYDDRWFMFVSDVDLCWRLHQRGWRVRYEPAVSMTRTASAGAKQAYGASLERRHLDAEADWVRHRHGRTWAFGWHAVNTVGCVRWAATEALHARDGRRARARPPLELARAHVRSALAGPPPAEVLRAPPKALGTQG